MSNIQINYTFKLFWCILGEIHIEVLFLVQKGTISEKRTEILGKYVFLTSLKRGKFWGKFGFVWTTLFDQTSKMQEILTKTCFSPQCVPHTDKLSFSVTLEHFWGNSQRTSRFSPKSDYLRKEHRNTQEFFFNKFEKRQIQRKIWICLNNFFCSNQ